MNLQIMKQISGLVFTEQLIERNKTESISMTITFSQSKFSQLRTLKESKSFKKKSNKNTSKNGYQLFELQIKKKLNTKKKKQSKKKMMNMQPSDNRIFGSVKNNNRTNFC